MSEEQQPTGEPVGHAVPRADAEHTSTAAAAATDAMPGQESKPVADSASPAGEASAAKEGLQRPADPQSADDVLTRKMPDEVPGGEERNAADAEVLADSRQRTRRAFVGFGIAAAAAYGVRRYLKDAPFDDMIPGLLHKGYAWNAGVSRAVFREDGMAPSYPVSKAENLRVNGIFGLKKMLKPESYRLQMVGVKGAPQHPRYVADVTAWNYEYDDATSHEDQGHDSKTDPSKVMSSTKMAPEEMQGKAQQDENGTGRPPRGQEEAGESDSTLARNTPGLLLTLDDFLPRLTKHDAVYQFKCIEGWSQFVHWGGVRMADFLDLYPPEAIDGKDPKYVYLETPDGDYYVGYDLKVLRHPQTMLVTEMNGSPLTQFHGAPLRLYTPLKYGYKQIKRIALIAYTNDKPDDYWTKLGYDWYAGL